VTKREYFEGYRALVRELFQPAAYFARTLPAFLELQAQAPLGALRRHGLKLLSVLLKEMYYFGLRDPALRSHFRRAFWKILRKQPAALEAFLFDCGVFYHLHRHADFIQRALTDYLSAPHADDLLDAVLDPSGPDLPSARRAGVV
jgi:hypothetical protein